MKFPKEMTNFTHPKTDVQVIIAWLKTLSPQELRDIKSQFCEEGTIDQVGRNLAAEGFYIKGGTLAKYTRS